MSDPQRFVEKIRNKPLVTATVRDLEDLVDAGVDINSNSFDKLSFNLLQLISYRSRIFYGTTKEDYYCELNQIKLLERLMKCALENGADPNVKLADTRNYYPPLKICVGGVGTWKMCRMLISNGVDVTSYKTRAYDKNPTEQILIYTRVRFLQSMLIEAGADPMAVIDTVMDDRSALTERVDEIEYIEDAFMITFYIEC